MPNDFLQFQTLQEIPGLRHAITTRSGGVSEGPYEALNLAYHVGDDPARVRQNRRLAATVLGYTAGTLVTAQQVHGTRSRVVTTCSAGSGALDWESALPETDALIINDRQVPGMVLVADCAPLLLVNVAHQLLAVVHAGWRGAVAGVAAATIERMTQDFATRPRDVLAGIGPCLCPDCFEVGPEVAAVAASLWDDALMVRAEGEKPHLDLRALLRHDLQKAGVLEENIETLPHCPRCMNETFFSHRGQNGVAGRFGLVAWWE